MGRIASIPAWLHFSFLCLLPHRPLGHSSWSGAPNYTSRVTDENDPSRRSETSCALKRGTSIPGPPPLRPVSPTFSSLLSVYVFFTPVATKGPLSVARRARLFYTPNVIQLQSYLKLLSLLSPLLCFCSSLYPRAVFLLRSKVFLKRRCGSHTRATKKVARGLWRAERYQEKLY